MRKIKFKTLTIQNFLSVGNDNVVIDFQNGLNLITGNNIDNPERRNGTGKSAVIEAFYYALFGTTIRDIKKEFVINNVTKGKGRIELTFDVTTDTETSSYRVVRQLKPSAVELYKCGDEDEDIAKDSIANTNKYICDLLGSNPVICKSCDILSLSDNIPFMAKKPEEKRKFIEDIFTLEIFGKMMKDLKDLIKENKAEMSITSAKIEEIVHSITTLQTQYDEQKKKSDDREELLNSRRADLEDRIEKLQIQVDRIVLYGTTEGLLSYNVSLHEKWEDLDKKLAANRFGLDVCNQNRAVTKNDLDKLENIKDGCCPVCLQDITSEHADHILTKIVAHRATLALIDADIKDLSVKNDNLNEAKRVIQAKIAENTQKLKENELTLIREANLIQTIEELKIQLNDLDDDIQTESGMLDFTTALIEEANTRKTDQEEVFETLKQTSEDLEVCKFILGEEGIKSFMIKRLLDMLNTSIQKYIIDLGMTMRCKFDEYFDEKITNDNGKDISYWNFSGGERRTVDLACAWAFKDIKRKISGTSSNVEFLDEIFDSAFDERGLDLLIEVLKERITHNNLSCYAISHRKETLKHVDGEIVELEKENKITRRI